MVKRVFLFALLGLSFTLGYSQDNVTNTLKNIQHIPEFKIFIAPDSSEFTNEGLQKNKPFILMFFNPDCDHCQKETKELLAYKEELKNIQIVMTTALPYRMVKEFYTDYNIASMPNIKMGQDPTFTLGTKYHPGRYPAIYIYDATGNLVKVFSGNVGVPTILEAVK